MDEESENLPAAQRLPDKLLSCKHRWPSIARDIALLAVPSGAPASYTAEDIARVYNLTTEEFVELTKIPAFVTIMRDELERIKSMGPNAGTRMRAEAMAVALQEQLFSEASNGELDEKTKLQFLGMLLRSAGLEQPPEAAKAAAAQNVVNIAFNIPKLRNNKLAHIVAQEQTNVVEVKEGA